MTEPGYSEEDLRRVHKYIAEWGNLIIPEALAAEFAKLRRERDEAAEKAKGQLDIIQRECNGEEDASIACDYGGLGWEQEKPVTTVRGLRQAAEKLAEALHHVRDSDPMHRLGLVRYDGTSLEEIITKALAEFERRRA